MAHGLSVRTDQIDRIGFKPGLLYYLQCRFSEGLPERDVDPTQRI